MSDLIDRQVAIDAIMQTFSKSLARQRAIDCINGLPPAQLERRTCRNCKYGGAYVGRRVICDHEYGLVDCGPESFCSLWSKKDEA